MCRLLSRLHSSSFHQCGVQRQINSIYSLVHGRVKLVISQFFCHVIFNYYYYKLKPLPVLVTYLQLKECIYTQTCVGYNPDAIPPVSISIGVRVNSIYSLVHAGVKLVISQFVFQLMCIKSLTCKGCQMMFAYSVNLHGVYVGSTTEQLCKVMGPVTLVLNQFTFLLSVNMILLVNKLMNALNHS